MKNVRIGAGSLVVAVLFGSQLAAQNKSQGAPQAPPNKPAQVTGSGTSGTVPVWTGTTSLGDSHIQSGAAVTINVPLNVSGAVTATTSTDFTAGVFGQADGSNAVGVQGNGASNGVAGYSLNTSGFGNGVIGVASSPDAVGVRGDSADTGGSAMYAVAHGTQAIAGNFENLAGGTILIGSVNGAVKFSVLGTGELTIQGNAFKPGGGSWGVLSDARTKRSIEPINDALKKLLDVRGVMFEYTNPSAFHELPGAHIGMIAQEVEKVFPSWVDTGEDGLKRVTFRGFEAVTVEALRQLNNQMSVNASEAAARIDRLEQENKELKHSMESLVELLKTR